MNTILVFHRLKILNFNKAALASVALLTLISCDQRPAAGYPSTYTPHQILENLLIGRDADHNSIEWRASPADLHEFQGQLSAKGTLYSFVDTTMVINRESEQVYYTVFHTAPMNFNEDGKLENANSCHVCGVNVGYFSYTIENDSIHVQKFKRNFAKHGSFGQKTYSLSMINLGDGYELLKVDDPYEGMGITSVSTRFYYDGELMLSMISKENNHGNREKSQNGYYEFESGYIYDDTSNTITIKQTGYEIDEKSGKKIITNNIKTLNFDGYTLGF